MPPSPSPSESKQARKLNARLLPARPDPGRTRGRRRESKAPPPSGVPLPLRAFSHNFRKWPREERCKNAISEVEVRPSIRPSVRLTRRRQRRRRRRSFCKCHARSSERDDVAIRRDRRRLFRKSPPFVILLVAERAGGKREGRPRGRRGKVQTHTAPARLEGRKESGNYLIRLSVHLEAGRPVSPFRQFVARKATSRSAAPRCV